MSRRIVGKAKQAPDAVTGGGEAPVKEVKIRIVKDAQGIDRVINEDVTDEILAQVEKNEAWKDGELVTARKEGKIHAFWSVATVTTKAKKVAKGGKRAYVRLETINARGMQILSRGVIDVQPKAPKGEKQPDSACDCFNYGFDLHRRQPIRNALEASLSGPEKAVKKLVLGLLAGDTDVDEIRAYVKAAKKFAGVEGIDRLIDLALATRK